MAPSNGVMRMRFLPYSGPSWTTPRAVWSSALILGQARGIRREKTIVKRRVSKALAWRQNADGQTGGGDGGGKDRAVGAAGAGGRGAGGVAGDAGGVADGGKAGPARALLPRGQEARAVGGRVGLHGGDDGTGALRRQRVHDRAGRRRDDHRPAGRRDDDQGRRELHHSEGAALRLEA